MNQKTGIVIAIVILVLVLLGIGAYMLMRKPQIQAPNPQTEQPATQNTTPQSSQGTLKSIFTSGKPLKCSFSNISTDSAKVMGTVYVASGKMRGDIQTSTGEPAINSHMIVDSQNSYIWTDMSKQGFKFSVTDQPQTSNTEKNQGPDLNQSVDYSCQDWSTDDSLFTLPSDISFSTFSVPTIPSTKVTGTPKATSQCALCDNIPAGADRVTCKAQLNCPQLQ